MKNLIIVVFFILIIYEAIPQTKTEEFLKSTVRNGIFFRSNNLSNDLWNEIGQEYINFVKDSISYNILQKVRLEAIYKINSNNILSNEERELYKKLIDDYINNKIDYITFEKKIPKNITEDYFKYEYNFYSNKIKNNIFWDTRLYERDTIDWEFETNHLKGLTELNTTKPKTNKWELWSKEHILAPINVELKRAKDNYDCPIVWFSDEYINDASIESIQISSLLKENKEPILSQDGINWISIFSMCQFGINFSNNGNQGPYRDYMFGSINGGKIADFLSSGIFSVGLNCKAIEYKEYYQNTKNNYFSLYSFASNLNISLFDIPNDNSYEITYQRNIDNNEIIITNYNSITRGLLRFYIGDLDLITTRYEKFKILSYEFVYGGELVLILPLGIPKPFKKELTLTLGFEIRNGNIGPMLSVNFPFMIGNIFNNVQQSKIIFK